MKPIKLIMSAFGPYASEEVIDFEILNGKNIFLITGPTGAGKTTIFDAISYALFGEASGSSRENDSLRSDFAQKDKLTYVELDFELRGEVYHIRRVPQQLKPKVKGEGFTNHSAEAELVLPDGKVKTGAMNVTNEINALMGINKEQFKQIVMLPQGEFKRLLLADSKEREGIFRKIFSTYTYEKIQSLLNDKASTLRKELEKSQDRVRTNVKNIKSKEAINIDDFIEFDYLINKIDLILEQDTLSYKELEKRYNDISKEILVLQERRIKSKNTNDLLKEKESISEKINDMLLRKNEIDKKEVILKRAINAKEIIYVEDNLSSRERSKKQKEEEVEDSKNILNRVKDELSKAEENLKAQEEKEEERTKIREEISVLKEKESKVKSIEDKKSKIKILNRSIDLNKLKSEEENRLIKELKKEKEEVTERLKAINELEKDRIKLEGIEKEKNELIIKVREVYKNIARFYEEKKKHREIAVTFEGIEVSYKNQKEEYERKEEIYMKEQAGILALNLKKDTPCPVCGSLEHPSPAKRMDNIPTEEELKSIKNIYEKKQDEYNKILMEMAKVKQSVDVVISDAITPRLKELSSEINCSEIFNENSFEEIKIKGIELSNELNKLKIQRESLEKEISKREKLELRLLDIEKLLNDKEETLNKLSNEYTNLFGELRAEEETLNNIEKEVPEELRSLNLLNKKIVSLEEYLNILIKNLDYTRELKNSLNNKLTSEQSKVKELEKAIDELNNDIKDIKTSINIKLKELNFINYEEYEDSKKYISLIDSYTLEINSYREDIKSLKDREKDLIKKTENFNFVNLEELDLEINSKQVNLKEVDQNIKEVYSLINNNSAILKEIKAIEKLISYKEEEYKVIGELSNLANGKKSPYITFERFVLASYFQEIIDSANIRLSKMTNDRFILKRKEDKGKGTSQQGLELEVYDNYTGKSRHVKTLSGGESFKASLSLALGLSDVVQANAGGISLDTMFIDEGFGTLDPESLENAINTLLELQRSGRLVGIISHVPELKERIEAQLEINVSAEGSSTKFNIN